ncbi:response regulator receiver protein [Solemya pervernicosa gill symbiont]|uniref:Response regulator receiver protein n=1 Tax=Solemya pervernicosa gill symbiont TaxID=642797 RepID=A0A1T2L970_9GAMM|nr:response regulator receiver protein [Solemya pervernicosa gill symbiont]OOZ41643.1 response regulator receiver protein [Solemya pervernicosa gill symbiont]
MDLIKEIITILSSQESSLSDALLKTKILLHKIGHKELVEWVNNELNGYPDKSSVPDYRVLHAEVLANAVNHAYQFNRMQIPIGHLPEEQQESLTNIEMDQSLVSLEKLVSKEGSHLRSPIPIETNYFLQEGLDESIHINSSWCEVQPSQIIQIFIQVRSRLLDFVLELQDGFGEGATDEELRDRSGELDTKGLFATTIFGDNASIGDNAIIVVGDNNQQSIANVAVKGDFTSLSDVLKKHNVADDDIAELERAIADDGQLDESKKEFGSSVKSWLQTMLSKAVYAAWQIELGIASNVLVDGLRKFYGWA